ncbi:peptidoglycan-binding protein [Solibacillus silvestris]
MALDGHTFGVFSQSQKGVRFTNVVAEIVDNNSINRPGNPSSPNNPRQSRLPNFTNPILGDEGNGKIGRWQEVKLEAVENLLDQMIELYLKDKTWYSTIRCREALWNMYRKLAWYVKYQVGQDIGKYQQALRLIKDCIYKIEHPEKIEERKVFEELFNVEDRYSNKLFFSDGFKWEDIYLRFKGSSSDGVMKVEGKQGEFSARLDRIQLNYDGYLTFQYGGRVEGTDSVELYDNGIKVWSSSKINTVGIETKTDKVKLEPGLHNFVWVYKSNGGASNPWFWLDVIRVFENKPIYSKYRIGLVDVINPPDLIHSGFDFDDLQLTNGWGEENQKLYATVLAGNRESIKKVVQIDSHESYFQFEYSTSESLETATGYVAVLIDGVEIWRSSKETHGTEFIRIDNLPIGEHTIEIVFWTEGYGNTLFTFRNFEVVEITDTLETDRKYNEMGIPYCPPPFIHRYNGAFYTDFNGTETEIELFNTAKLPLFDDFPGYFRYVSSSEEQEWDIARSVGGKNEMLGNENILKMDVSKLKHGNHTKITTVWKFKERGNVTFDFLASVDKGNGLIFFINDRQVSKEWNQSNEWGQATFNVQPGQTYKFDWLIRSKSTKKWGLNAVYLKNIRFSEVIPSWHNFFPKRLGEEGYGEWYTNEEKSVIEGALKGDRVNLQRVFEGTLCGECPGEIQFSYTLDTEDPERDDFELPFYIDDFSPADNFAKGSWGKDKWSGSKDKWDDTDPIKHSDGEADWNTANSRRSGFTFDGQRGSTIDSTSTAYEAHAFKDYLLDRNRLAVKGTVSIECPLRYIHHYDPVETTPARLDWSLQGNMWDPSPNGISASGEFEPGTAKATTSLWLEYSGNISFDVDLALGSNDKLVIYVNGNVAWQKSGSISETVSLDVAAGNTELSFELIASGDGEQVLKPVGENAQFNRPLNYAVVDKLHRSTVPSALIDDENGSTVSIFRNNWWQGDEERAYTDNISNDYTITFKIAPGATLSFSENVRFVTSDDIETGMAEPYKSSSGDTCYPAGDDKYDIDYNVLSKSITSKQKDTLGWNSNFPNVYKGASKTYHYTTASQAKVVRTVTAGPTSDVIFSEDLIVHKGKSPNGGSLLMSLNLQEFAEETVFFTEARKVHNLKDFNGTKVSKSGSYFTEGVLKLSFNYDLVLGGKGEALVQIINADTGRVVGKPLDKTVTTDGTVNFKMSVTRGRYYVKFSTTKLSGSGQGLYAEYTNIKFIGTTEEKEPPKPTVPTPPGGNLPPGSGGGGYQDPCAGVNKSAGDAGSKDPTVFPGYAITNCMQGSYVKAIQARLGITADGIFGPATSAALKEFQKKNGLSPGGVVYSDTWEKLFAKPPKPTPTPDYTVYPGEPVRYMDSSEWVKTIQRKLIEKGYPISGGADGYYGPSTRDAVRQFQEDYGLPVRDHVDKVTWNKLLGDLPPVLDNDGTKVRVVVKDKKTGQVIMDDFYEPYGDEQDFMVYTEVPKGHTYEITYTLLKGTGKKGGLLDQGGGMVMKNGNFISAWDDYCIGKDGKPYPKEDKPVSNPTLGSPSFKVTVPEIGYDQTFTGMGGIIDFTYTNNTSSTKTLNFKGKLIRDNPTDQVEINRGLVIIAQPGETELVTMPNSIGADVNGFKVVEQVPHWTGGCDIYNSRNYMYVKLLDANGNELDRRTFNGSGQYDFEFYNLGPLPYPDYRVVIESEQGGGYDELHPGLLVFNPYSFHIDKFEVWEIFKAIPDPFNSVLDFYINDVLQGTYNPLAINEYLDLIFLVEKGCNKYKWVLRPLDDRTIWSWDRAKIDWIELTNWICDEIMVTPYCERKQGDKCIEALIHCLLPVVRPDPEDPEQPEPEEPIACKIGKKIWLFT